MTSGNDATALAKRVSHCALCWAVRTATNTVTPALSARRSSSATRARMIPSACSRLMRRQHGVVERPTLRAISASGMSALSCRQSRIFRSKGSRDVFAATGVSLELNSQDCRTAPEASKPFPAAIGRIISHVPPLHRPSRRRQRDLPAAHGHGLRLRRPHAAWRAGLFRARSFPMDVSQPGQRHRAQPAPAHGEPPRGARGRRLAFLALAGLLAACPATGQERSMVPVTVDGEQVKLAVITYKPDGNGPFPVLIFHHGSTGRGNNPANFSIPYEPKGL